MGELKVAAIVNGTVIDHIASGRSLKVLRILGIDENLRSTVSVLMHVESKKLGGWKDVVKIEDRELDAKEVDKIALIAPQASINIIRNSKVAGKHRVEPPDIVKGLLKCPNTQCISNRNEPVIPVFVTESREPLRLRCRFCERDVEDVENHIM